MYAKIELTRQTFRLWKWKIFVTEELFVGPFKTSFQRDLRMRFVANLTIKLLRDKPHVIVSWRELELLPTGTEAIASHDAMDVVLSFIADL